MSRSLSTNQSTGEVSTKKVCGVTFHDVSVDSDGQTLLADIVDAFNQSGSVRGLSSFKALGDAVAFYLSGGWAAVVEDSQRRHSGHAWKFTTVEMFGDVPSTLTFSLEATTGGHSGAWSLVSVFLTVTTGVRDGENETGTYALTQDYAPKVQFLRDCGCPVKVRGGIGAASDLSARDVVAFILALRGAVRDGSAALMVDTVRDPEGHRSALAKWRNLWSGGYVKRGKVTVSGEAL